MIGRIFESVLCLFVGLWAVASWVIFDPGGDREHDDETEHDLGGEGRHARA